MAENTKLILRSSSNELFITKNYKLKPELVISALDPSLSTADKLIQHVAAIHYNGSDKSVSQFNNQSLFNTINAYRNGGTVTYDSIVSSNADLLEYIPKNLNIYTAIEDLDRMQTEYPQKNDMLTYLVNNLFDVDYAKNINNFGRASLITVPDDGIISPAFGYIIADNAPENLELNLIIRGIPVPMRKTLTSSGTYYFTYPQYLIDTDESVNSIQHIEVLNQGSSILYKGTATAFPLYSDSGDYINLRIINKESRNSSLEAVDFEGVNDPEWNKEGTSGSGGTSAEDGESGGGGGTPGAS
jgi:hypothetical protein